MGNEQPIIMIISLDTEDFNDVFVQSEYSNIYTQLLNNGFPKTTLQREIFSSVENSYIKKSDELEPIKEILVEMEEKEVIWFIRLIRKCYEMFSIRNKKIKVLASYNKTSDAESRNIIVEIYDCKEEDIPSILKEITKMKK